MRIARVSYELYDYEELSPEAKQKARERVIEEISDVRNTMFEEACNNLLAEEFPNSDLTVHYSLGYCQGDGLNIEGTVKLYDVLPKLNDFSKKEIDTLEQYFERMDANHR